VSRNLLSGLKRSLTFKINGNPGGTQRMTADRDKYTGINRSPPNRPKVEETAGWSGGKCRNFDSGEKPRFVEIRHT
jgi:hypothetical protein